MIRRGRIEWLPVGNFQLHTAVNGVAFQAVQADDLFVAPTLAKILSGNSPEGIALFHVAGATGLDGFDWLCLAVKGRRDLGSQITHAGIQPVAGTALYCINGTVIR